MTKFVKAFVYSAAIALLGLGCGYGSRKPFVTPDLKAEQGGIFWRDCGHPASSRFGKDLSDQDVRCAVDTIESMNRHGIDLNGADMSNCRLPSVNLAGAKLSGANFNFCDLRGADFSGADLRGASFQATLLAKVSFARSNLAGADLANALVSGGDFSGADLSRTRMANANLGPFLDESMAFEKELGTWISEFNKIQNNATILFHRAVLKQTDMRGAKFEASTLVAQQLSDVCFDAFTQLPLLTGDMPPACSTANCGTGSCCSGGECPPYENE